MAALVRRLSQPTGSASDWVGVAIGVVLPLPALTLPLVRVHNDPATDALLPLAATVVALAMLHWLVFRQRRADQPTRTADPMAQPSHVGCRVRLDSPPGHRGR